MTVSPTDGVLLKIRFGFEPESTTETDQDEAALPRIMLAVTYGATGNPYCEAMLGYVSSSFWVIRLYSKSFEFKTSRASCTCSSTVEKGRVKLSMICARETPTLFR